MFSKAKTVLRFSIRDLLWFTLVVAMAFGWLKDRPMLISQRNDAESELMEAQMTVATLERHITWLHSALKRHGLTVNSMGVIPIQHGQHPAATPTQ